MTSPGNMASLRRTSSLGTRFEMNPANEPRYPASPDGGGGDRRLVAALPWVIRWTFLAALAVGLLTAWLVAGAETLTGRVVGISDGDTITVLVGREEVKVRLADIASPE